MQISALPSDECFTEAFAQYSLLLDGLEVTNLLHCVYADDESGAIIFVVVDRAGIPIEPPNDSGFILGTCQGKVEIKYKGN